MFKLLKVDFYKLFRSVSFYVCAALVVLFGLLSVFLTISSYLSYGIDPAWIGVNAMETLRGAISTPPLILPILTGIFIAIFTVKDFSNGSIKNLISRGYGKVTYFFSKLITNFVSALIYTILSLTSAFILGGYLFGFGEPTKEDYIHLLISIGMFMLIMLTMVTLVTMFAFVFRNSAATVALAVILSSDILNYIISSPINYLVITVLKWSEDFELLSYWPMIYPRFFVNLTSFPDPYLTRGLIVCGSWFVVSLAIGIFTAWKRDIK